MTVHFGTPKPIRAISDAVPLYGRGEFESPTRSTIPLLSLLIHSPQTFDAIIRELGFPSEYDMFLEYTVRSPGGRGKASHTDAMLTSGTSALAIEGKWTEPMYETVANWLKSGNNRPNKESVLDGWLSLLRRHTAKPLYAGDFDTAIYQMVHRAASAATAERPHLAYFLFEPSPDKRAASPSEVFGKLTDLWNRLGKPATFLFHLVEIEATPLPAYEAIRLLPKGEESTAEAICAALQASDPLFRFGVYQIQQIG